MEKVTPFSRPLHGFTLVELLVVIGIIAMLAALVSITVMDALTKARNAAIKAEIDMLHMAIMNYKAEYGSFPPCVSTTGTSDAAARHILRAFPRTANIASEVSANVTPQNSIVGWLSGYTSNPQYPVSGTATSPRQKLFDFDTARISSGLYHPSGKANSPYIYIRSGTSSTTGYGTITGTTTNASYTVAPNTYRPEIQVTSSGTGFFNPDTFQILCAGLDEDWGTEDDLSNFWPGTRGDYIESLTN